MLYSPACQLPMSRAMSDLLETTRKSEGGARGEIKQNWADVGGPVVPILKQVDVEGAY